MKCNKLKVYYIVFVGLLLAAFFEFIVYINLCTNKIELGNNKGLEYINYITQTSHTPNGVSTLKIQYFS